MPDNHEEPFYMGATPDQRVTKLTEVGLDAMKESGYYLEDDKVAVLITNEVTKSDWDKSECGMGFWNFENPRDLINTLVNHIMAIGEGYGIGIGVMEAKVEYVSNPLDDIIRQALAVVAEEVCECPKCTARRVEKSDPPHISQVLEQLMKDLEHHERGHNAESE